MIQSSLPLDAPPPTLYRDEHDRERHALTVQRLADSTGTSAAHLLPLYEDVLRVLVRRARVLDYLPIFTERRVRELVRRND